RRPFVLAGAHDPAVEERPARPRELDEVAACLELGRQQVERDHEEDPALENRQQAADDGHHEARGDCQRHQGFAHRIRTLSGRTAIYKWLGFSQAASAASLSASLTVGWAWQTRPMSSADAENSIASTASAIMVPASAPMMCTPITWSVALSASTFTKPSVIALARLRGSAVKGYLPTL